MTGRANQTLFQSPSHLPLRRVRQAPNRNTVKLTVPAAPRSTRVTVQLPRPLGVLLQETRAFGDAPHVVVSAVSDDGPARGLVYVGDVLLTASGKPAASLTTVVKQIEDVSTPRVTLTLQRNFIQDVQPPVKSPNPPPDDRDEQHTPTTSTSHDLYDHQDVALSNLISAYAFQRKNQPNAYATQQSLDELLSVASQIVKQRSTATSHRTHLISSVHYRLKRANIPLSAKFYNILIWSLIQANEPQRAVSLFEEIPNPNVECFTTLIKAYSMLRNPDAAIALIPRMRSANVQPNIRTYNALIASCVRGGKLAKARQLFSEMLVDDVAPNVVSWNIIINWHVQQKRGPKRLHGALEAFADMKQSGVSPNVVTFTTLMKAYAKSGLFNKAEEVFTEMKQRMPSKLDTNVYNTLLSAYSSRLEWRRCLELLTEMQKDTTSDGYLNSSNDSSDSFYGLPHHSSFSRRRPWLADSSSSPPAPGASTASSEKQILHEEENKQRMPDAVSYSLVVKACAMAGRPDRAREVFDEMMQNGIYPPPGPAVVSLMSGYAKAGQFTESFAMLQNLKLWGVFPDARMLSTLMHACLTSDQPGLAISVYAKFKAAKFEPDVVTYTLLLKAYGMNGELDKAFNVLKAMVRHGGGMRPNIVTYNALIECSLLHGRSDLALKALDELLRDDMTKTKVNRKTFEALVGSLAKYEVSGGANVTLDSSARVEGDIEPESQLQYLMDVLRRLREGGATPNGTLYWALLHACERCQEWYLGLNLVSERENGGFLVGRKDLKEIRILEDAFKARSAIGPLVE